MRLCLSSYINVHINMVSKLTMGQISISQNKVFDRFLHENWAIAQKSSTTPEAKAYHLIPQVTELVDQDFLIDNAGCDESLKCARCPTLRCPFCFDLQVLTGTTSNGLINPSSHPIHKLFRMEVEDDCISEETRSLWGVYWNWKRVLWEWEWLAKWRW